MEHHCRVIKTLLVASFTFLESSFMKSIVQPTVAMITNYDHNTLIVWATVIAAKLVVKLARLWL